MNSACAEILLHKMLVTPHLRRIKFFEFWGTLFYFTCSAEMNSACAEILLHNLIVSTNFQRHICAPTEGSPSQGELSAELTEGVPSILY